MFILLTTFLFIFTPFAMMVLHLIRPKFSIQGFLVAMAVMVGWPMVFLARSDIPRTITLIQWKPESLFPISPSILVDDISWYFALALASLALSVVITSIAQIGQISKTDQLQAQTKNQVTEDQNHPDEGISSREPIKLIDAGSTPNWLLWASILVLTSLGLVAVAAGNILTMLLAWAALDLIELSILLGQMVQSKIRERIILAFSIKMAGIVTVFIAGIMLWSHGASLSFDAISKSVSTYLVLAVSLRLGVLLLHLPFPQGLPITRGLGTVLRLVPAASSYILLVRVSTVGIPDAVTPYLLVLTALAGLFAAVNWLGAKNELTGRPYWLLGTASLVVAAAILNHPGACLAWSITSLLSGGLIFSMSIHHRNLIPLVILGLINLSALPFSPTWQGATIYQYTSSSPVHLTLFSLLSLFFLLIQSFLLAGFIRHALRGIFPVGIEISDHIERWVWFLYPTGLIFIVVTHLLIGWWLHQSIDDVTLIGWIIGPVSLILTGMILYIAWRFPHPYPLVSRTTKTSFWNNLFSLAWLYRLLWNIFRTSAKFFALFSTLLEGDGGILWALVLFGLIFVFLQR